MGVFAVLKYLLNHPLNKRNKVAAFWRFVLWQLYKRFFPYPLVFPFTEKCTLLARRDAPGATNNLYSGLHEYENMSLLLHFLRPADTFIDIGANVGSYTVLASGHVGAKTICFEPIPATYEKLRENIGVNVINERVQALNVGLGAEKGQLRFTNDLDCQNHVALATDTSTIDVPVERLDNMIAGESPSMIKIDVEGYETEVFKAGDETLKNPSLKVIVIEFGGWSARMGLNDDILREKFKNNGFKLYKYNPQARTFEAGAGGDHNSLYIRDLEFVQKRVTTAEKIKVNGNSY